MTKTDPIVHAVMEADADLEAKSAVWHVIYWDALTFDKTDV